MSFEFELRARVVVLNAMKQGGELWELVSPATVEALIRAVTYDLMDQADRASDLSRPGESSLSEST